MFMSTCWLIAIICQLMGILHSSILLAMCSYSICLGSTFKCPFLINYFWMEVIMSHGNMDDSCPPFCRLIGGMSREKMVFFQGPFNLLWSHGKRHGNFFLASVFGLKIFFFLSILAFKTVPEINCFHYCWTILFYFILLLANNLLET